MLEHQGSSYILQLPMREELFSVFVVKQQLENKPQIIFCAFLRRAIVVLAVVWWFSSLLETMAL